MTRILGAPGRGRPRRLPSMALLASGVVVGLTKQHALAKTPELATEEAQRPAPVMEELIVMVQTRNRAESLQEVPISISVVSGEDLERELALDFFDITKRAANVILNPGNPRQSSLAIRGVGKQGQTDAQDPSVGVIVDGVNYAYNPLSYYDFVDIESIEVARGPQGTLLGKNTTMGVLNITTRQPSFEPDFNYSLTLGDRKAIIATAAGGGPIIDDLLAWRGTLSLNRQDGPFPNLYDYGARSYTDRNRMHGRAQFLFTPGDNLSVRFAVDVTPRTAENTNGLTFYKPLPPTYSNGAPVNPANDPSVILGRRWFVQDEDYDYYDDYIGNGLRGAVNNDAQMPLISGTTGASARIDWDVGNFTVTSITAYKNYFFEARNDEGTPFDVDLNRNTTVHYSQQSQELRISSSTGGFIDYQTGIFLLNSQNRYNAKQEWGSDAGAWYATPAQYELLDRDASGRHLLLTSLDRAFRLRTDEIDNESAAIFGQANFHFTDNLTLTAGLRFTREDRKNRTTHVLTKNGYGAELNPVAVNGVALGGFASDLTGALLPGNSAEQLSLADSVAFKYFGVAATGTPGEAYSSLSEQQLAQVAAAKALRQTRIGTLWNTVDAEPFKETQPSYLISPSYRIGDAFMVYASWQYGEKAGIAQFTNGLPDNARPEKNSAYEVGFKSSLLDNNLILNVAAFVNEIEDYQQSVRVVDEYTTALRNDGETYYTTATGNVPKVRVEGLEIDATYSGIRNLFLRFAGALNDARYAEFPNAAQPPENGYPGAPPYRDVSGERLAGAPKFSFNVGAEYRVPVFGNKELHASLTYFYTDEYNEDNSLSAYGWVDAYGLTDVSFGIGRDDGAFDVSVVAKNVFDTKYRSEGWGSWTPNNPRWVGLVLRGRW